MKATFHEDYGCCPKFNETKTEIRLLCETCTGTFCPKCAEQHIKTHYLTPLKKYIEMNQDKIKRELHESINDFSLYGEYLKTMPETRKKRWDFASQKLINEVDDILKCARGMSERIVEMSTLIESAAKILKGDQEISEKEYVKMMRISNELKSFVTYIRMVKIIKELDDKFRVLDDLGEEKEDALTAARNKYKFALEVVAKEHEKLNKVKKESTETMENYEKHKKELDLKLSQAFQYHEETMRKYKQELVDLEVYRNQQKAVIDEDLVKYTNDSNIKKQALDASIAELNYKAEKITRDLENLTHNEAIIKGNINRHKELQIKLTDEILSLKQDVKDFKKRKDNYDELCEKIKLSEGKLEFLQKRQELYNGLEDKIQSENNKLQILKEKVHNEAKNKEKEKAELNATIELLIKIKSMIASYRSATDICKQVEAKLKNISDSKEAIEKNFNIVQEGWKEFMESKTEKHKKILDSIANDNKRLKQIRANIAEQESEKAKVEKDVELANKELVIVKQNLQKAKQELDTKIIEHEKLSKEDRQARADIKAMKAQKENKNKKLSELNRLLSDLKADIKLHNNAIENLKLDKINMEKELERSNEQLNKYKKEKIQGETLLKNLKSEHQEQIKKHNQLKANVNKLEEEKNKLIEQNKRQASLTYYCKRELEDLQGSRENLLGEIKKLNNEVSALAKSKKDKEEVYNTIAPKLKQMTARLENAKKQLKLVHEYTKENLKSALTATQHYILEIITIWSKITGMYDKHRNRKSLKKNITWITCTDPKKGYDSYIAQKFFWNINKSCWIDFWIKLFEHVGYAGTTSLRLCDFKEINKNVIPSTLSDIVRISRNLLTLDLTGNCIDSSFLTNLFKVLPKHPLRCLFLNYCELTKPKEIATIIANRIPETNLEHFSARETPLNSLIEELVKKREAMDLKLKYLEIYYDEPLKKPEELEVYVNSLLSNAMFHYLRLTITYKSWIAKDKTYHFGCDYSGDYHDCNLS